MIFVSLIDRYILREFWFFFTVTFGVTVVILLIQKLFRLAPLLAHNQIELVTIVQLLGYVVLAVSGLTLPVAFLIACTLTFHRFSTDSEYLVMRAHGLSFYRLLLPLFCVSIVMFGLSSAALQYGSPWGFLRIRRLFVEVARSNVQAFVSPGELHNVFKGLVLYVDRGDPKSGRLEGIFIADSRTQPGHVITAKRGEVLTSEGSFQVVLRLEQGHLHRHEPERSRYHLLHFERYDVRLDLNTYIARWVNKDIKPREMLPDMLRQEIARRRANGEKTSHLTLLRHQALTLPFACIVFAGLGASLGIVNTRSGRSSGYVAGIGVVFVYYLLLTVSEAFGKEMGLPLLLAAWWPNIVMGIATLWVVQRTNRGIVNFGLFSVADWLRRFCPFRSLEQI